MRCPLSDKDCSLSRCALYIPSESSAPGACSIRRLGENSITSLGILRNLLELLAQLLKK